MRNRSREVLLVLALLAIGWVGACLGYSIGHQGGYKQGQLDAVWTCAQKH